MALGKTVAELQATTTSQELTYWLAFDQLCPFGEERADLRAGIVASTIANCNCKKTYKAKDFMPKFGGSTKQSAADWFAELEAKKKTQS